MEMIVKTVGVGCGMRMGDWLGTVLSGLVIEPRSSTNVKEGTDGWLGRESALDEL
jgi:hypothetical protein